MKMIKKTSLKNQIKFFPANNVFVLRCPLKVHSGNLDKKGEKKVKVFQIFIYLDSVDFAVYHHGSFSPMSSRPPLS